MKKRKMKKRKMKTAKVQLGGLSEQKLHAKIEFLLKLELEEYLFPEEGLAGVTH